MSLNEIRDVKLSIKRYNGALYYFYKLFVYISFWLRWVFIAALGLSLGEARGGYSPLQCSGISCFGARALGHRLNSCGTWG